jgi:Rnl2 family RNA ligase
MRPYPKIPRELDRLPGGEWIATEKLHGANLALGTVDGVCAIAKRGGPLRPEDWPAFFGVQRIYPRLHEVWDELSEALGNRDWTLYGELVGDGYPAGNGAVQREVSYCDELCWVPFDLLLGERWISHDELYERVDALGLQTPPILTRGSRQTVLQTPVSFSTRLPAVLGLPAIAGNLAEGWVARPSGEQRADAAIRLKRTRAAFAETVHGGAYADDRQVADGFTYARAWALACVTPARLSAARSKTGSLQDQAFYDELVRDVVEETTAVYYRLTAAEQTQIDELIRSAAYALAA